MPKKSVKNRNARRVICHHKHEATRDALRIASKDEKLTLEERMAASRQLQKQKRDASRSRQRNRCSWCGRPRGYNRLTGLCRLHQRLLVMIQGVVPGVRKASW